MASRIEWLIDTNAVSEMMRPRPGPRDSAFFDLVADEGLGLASVTTWEVFDGVGRLDPDRFQNLLDDMFEDRIVEWYLTDAQASAHITEEKRRRGEDHRANRSSSPPKA